EIAVELDPGIARTALEAAATLTRTDRDGAEPVPVAVEEGAGRSYVLRPRRALESAARYTLTLAPPRMDPPFESRFRTRRFGRDWTFATPDANDLVRMGSVLFVAAGARGLVVLDVSHPDGARLLGEAPTRGTARGVALLDLAPPGGPRALRALLCGGGDA